MNTLPSDKDKLYNWIVTPDAYLATALILCKKIPNTMSDSITNGCDVFKDIGFQSSHPNYELIYPIIFNFKHGIELYLKGLGCVDHNMYATVHNLQWLFDYIITNAPDEQSKIILQKLKEETWIIIKKYYFGTYVPYIKDETKPDIMNEAERYPQNERTYDPKDPYEWVSGGKLKEIEEDIRFIEKKFAQAKRDISNIRIN